MRWTSWQFFGAAAVAGLFITHQSRAAIIFGETATASSFIGLPFDRGVLRGIDDSGLTPGDASLATPDQFHSSVPDGNMWLSSGAAFGGVDNDPTYTVDLGAVYGVTGLRVWNYNENSNNPALFTMRGVRDTNILISLDNNTYVPLGLFTINQAPGNDSYTGDFVNVAALNGGNPLPFRYFRLDIQSSWGGDNNFYGLSEIAFEGTVVPEPGSALLLSIATAGLLSRRRR